MATTGSVSVDLNNFSKMINNTSTLGENVTQGVADQGQIIGLAIGLVIGLGLLFGLIMFVYGKLTGIVSATKGLNKMGK